jgi:hypothetical protein
MNIGNYQIISRFPKIRFFNIDLNANSSGGIAKIYSWVIRFAFWEVRKFADITNALPKNFFIDSNGTHYLQGLDNLKTHKLVKQLICGKCKVPGLFKYSSGKEPIHEGCAIIREVKCSKCGGKMGVGKIL